MLKNNLNSMTAAKDQAAQDYLDNWNNAADVTAQLQATHTDHYAVAAQYNPDRYAWHINRPLRTAPLAALTHLIHCELQSMFLETEPGTLPQVTEYIEPPILDGVQLFDLFEEEGETFVTTLFQLIANASQQVQRRIHNPDDYLHRYTGLWNAYVKGYDRVVHGRKIAGEDVSVWPQASESLNVVWADNSIVALETLTKFSLFNALTGDPSRSALYQQSLRDAEGIGMLANMRDSDGVEVLHTDRLSEHFYSDASRLITPAHALPFAGRDPNGKLRYDLKAFKEDGSVDRPGHCPARPLTTPKDYEHGIAANHGFNALVNAEAGIETITESCTRFSSAANLIRLGALVGRPTIYKVWPE